MTDTDCGEDDEGLALGTIFTVSLQIMPKLAFLMMVQSPDPIPLAYTGGTPAGTSSSTIARTDNRSLRKRHRQPRG